MRTTGVFLDTRTLAACTGDYGATPERAVDLLGSGRALASNCVSGSEAGRACFVETVAGRGRSASLLVAGLLAAGQTSSPNGVSATALSVTG